MISDIRSFGIIGCFVLLFAAIMGFSRGGIYIVMSTLLLIAIVKFFGGQGLIPVDRELRKVMIFFFAVLFMSSSFSSDATTSFRFFAISIIRVLPFFAVAMFVKERKLTEYAVLLMGLSVSIGSAIALWQAFCGMIRVKSGLGMMDFAGIVGLIVPVLIVKSFDESIDRWKRNLFLFSAVLAMFALLFNQTRAVWVAILINCIIFVLLNIIYNTRKSRQAASTILVILAAISLFIATHQFTVDRVNSLTDMKFRSNHERIYMWNYAANVFLDHWDRGVGLAMLPSFAFSYTPEGSANVQITSTRSGHMHNNFLQLLAENGILGGIAYVLLFLRILKTAINHMNKAETRSWAMIAFLCTFEFLIHGMFDYTFSIGTIMFSYWFILGLSYVNFRETDAQPACAQ